MAILPTVAHRSDGHSCAHPPFRACMHGGGGSQLRSSAACDWSILKIMVFLRLRVRSSISDLAGRLLRQGAQRQHGGSGSFAFGLSHLTNNRA